MSQNDNTNKILAVFDFDGTITYKDSFLPFILHVVGFKKFYIGLFSLSPRIILYFIKIVSRKSLKEMFISQFFLNMSDNDLQLFTKSFIDKKLPKLINPLALQCIMRHEELGHRVIVISANIEDLVGKWCDKVGISEYSCTSLSKKDGNLTGRINGKNCYGKEKVQRLISLVGPLVNFIIYAYGDSKGDKELLEISNQSFYKGFPKTF